MCNQALSLNDCTRSVDCAADEVRHKPPKANFGDVFIGKVVQFTFSANPRGYTVLLNGE